MSTRASVFIITLLLGWFFFGWFGDFNMYVVHQDGSRWIKEQATLSDRIIYGFIIAFVFATLQAALLWLWQRLRSRGGSRTVAQHAHTTA